MIGLLSYYLMEPAINQCLYGDLCNLGTDTVQIW